MPTRDLVIVGGGISGLTVLHLVRARRPDWRVELVEGEGRLGGTVGTDVVDGHRFDHGPNGFLDREPLTLALCHELGLDDDLERADERAGNRYILREGHLRPVPTSPGAFLGSQILSRRGKLRLLAEPFRPTGGPGDESVRAFAARRIGPEAADHLVQPMVSGIYGGLADRLSLPACFPTMRAMEADHGSLTRAMVSRRRAARRDRRNGRGGPAVGGPAGPSGRLTTFRGGTHRLIDRLEERHGAHIRTSLPISVVTRRDGNGDGYEVHSASGEVLAAHRVVVATPAHAAATMLEPLSPALAGPLAQIPYAPIAVVGLGIRRADIDHDLDGFGFLVPPLEERAILGVIWTTSIFADRAPDGYVQLRVMLGGDGNREVVERSDDELVGAACRELGDVLGLRGEPALTNVHRWRAGIPQFVLGHRERIAAIDAALAEHPGLHLAGNAYDGVGLNDCVARAHHVLDELTAT
ncbi:MAG: protoporphyrinogen oxidase [Actinomycetota bacterium]|nr:protoporphyrinogen oxidase [Actinomycetota bacterium]